MTFIEEPDFVVFQERETCHVEFEVPGRHLRSLFYPSYPCRMWLGRVGRELWMRLSKTAYYLLISCMVLDIITFFF
jgi:hypothetical protein